MTTTEPTYINWTLIGTGTQIHSDLAGANYVIGPNAMIVSTDFIAIELRGSGSQLQVQGFVSGGFAGVSLRNSALHVTAGGDLFGEFTGAFVFLESQVLNEGSIRGAREGMRVEFENAAVIENHGLIQGADAGIAVFGPGYQATGDVVLIENWGMIAGGYSIIAAQMAGASVHVVNHGTLLGDVSLGWGDDIFDNRAGQWTGSSAAGYIDGSVGSDVYMPGAGVEIIRDLLDFDNWIEIDTLDFSTSAGLRVSLADPSGTGWAAGDIYQGIERVVGSAMGDDTLVGDGLANILEGRGGKDVLEGSGGADRLLGGLDADRLLGGEGDDAFVFESSQEGGDFILDFGLAGDDRIEIDASAFGGGLVEGALDPSQFVISRRPAGHDADDRFIFRTTDATLWFDEDGRGRAKAVMIADLQAGAELTAADILLV